MEESENGVDHINASPLLNLLKISNLPRANKKKPFMRTDQHFNVPYSCPKISISPK